MCWWKCAKVSLVRTGLLSASCIKTSPDPVRLKVANGQYMGGGSTEVHLEMEFLNHEELSRPDKGKSATLVGTFYEAEWDWHVIIRYDFMAATDTGVQPAQSSIPLCKDDCLSWLSAHPAFEESHWAHAEREQLCRAVRAVKPCQRPLDEYGFTPEAFQEAVAGFGADEPSVDAFSSAYSESLRLCKTYWPTKDSAWFNRWDEHFWGLLWIHCNPGYVPRAIAKIKSNRAKALLVLTEKVWEDDRMVEVKDDLERMTLNSYEFPAGHTIYQDARGQQSGNTPGRTTVVYVDGSLLDESEADIRMVARVVAEPMRYTCTAPSQEADQYREAGDNPTADELDVVVGYMHKPMHEITSAKGSKDETEWWKDDSLASGAFNGNAFVRRVLDH